MFWEKRKNAGNDREGVNAGRGWSSPQSVFINISGWHCKKTDAYIFFKFGNILIQKNSKKCPAVAKKEKYGWYRI